MPDPIKVRRFQVQVQWEDGSLCSFDVDRPASVSVDVGGAHMSPEDFTAMVLRRKMPGGFTDFVLRAEWDLDTTVQVTDRTIRSKANYEADGGQAGGKEV